MRRLHRCFLVLASLLCNISCAVPLRWRVRWRLLPFWLEANLQLSSPPAHPDILVQVCAFTHYITPVRVFARVSFGPREEAATPRKPSQSEAVRSSAGRVPALVPPLCSTLSPSLLALLAPFQPFPCNCVLILVTCDVHSCRPCCSCCFLPPGRPHVAPSCVATC